MYSIFRVLSFKISYHEKSGNPVNLKDFILFNCSFLQFDCFSLTLKWRWNFLARHGPKPWRRQYDVSLPTKIAAKRKRQAIQEVLVVGKRLQFSKRWKNRLVELEFGFWNRGTMWVNRVCFCWIFVILWWTFRPWWWQLTHFSFLLYLGRCSKLTNISQMGWKPATIATSRPGWLVVGLSWPLISTLDASSSGRSSPLFTGFKNIIMETCFTLGKSSLPWAKKGAPFCSLGDLLGLNNYPVIRKFQSIIIRTPIKQPCSIIPGGPKTIK